MSDANTPPPNRWGYRIAYFAFALVLSACASAPGLRYTAVEPAESPGASSMRHVAVMRFDGWHGQTASDALDTALRAATFQGMSWFRVGPDPIDYDPSYPGGENVYSTSIGGDADAAIDYGRRHGLDAVWVGDTWSDTDVSGPYWKTKTRCTKWVAPFNCKTEEEYEVECVKHETEVEVRARLISVKTGRVIYEKSLSDSDTERNCTNEYGYWEGGYSPHHGWSDDDRRERKMIADCARRLAKYVVPRERTVHAELMEAPYYPYAELAGSFPMALEAADADLPANACDRFRDMAANYSDEPSVIFNLGVCIERTGDLDGALAEYDKAVAAAGPSPREAFLEHVNGARERIASLKHDQSIMDAVFEARDQYPSN